MRLRNIKDAPEIVSKSSYVINNPENFKGKYNKLFNNNNDLEIEIGMGKGNFIIKKAKENKNINYIGIEKYNSVLLSAIKKLEGEDLPNLKLICFDASLIENIFSKEVDKIYLNFSDPWPKKRHYKRRLTSPNFLEKYEKIVKNEVIIEMKTDNDDLFNYSVDTFKDNDYKLSEVNRNYIEPVYVTEYEQKFISKGKNINRLVAVKSLQK